MRIRLSISSTGPLSALTSALPSDSSRSQETAAAPLDETNATAAFFSLESHYGESGNEISAEHLRMLTSLRESLRENPAGSLLLRVSVRAEHQARVLAGVEATRAISENKDWVRDIFNFVTGNDEVALGHSRLLEEEEGRIHTEQREGGPSTPAEEAERLLAVQAYYESVSPELGDAQVQEVLRRDHPERLAIVHNTNERLYELRNILRLELSQNTEPSPSKLQTAALLVSINEHLQRTPYLGGDSRYNASSTSFIQHKEDQLQLSERAAFRNLFTADLRELRSELMVLQSSGTSLSLETQQALGEYLQALAQETPRLSNVSELHGILNSYFDSQLQNVIQDQTRELIKEDLRQSFEAAITRGDATWIAAHSSRLSNPSSGALEASITNDLIAHRLLSRAHHSDTRDQELALRINAAERFSRSDLYLANRVSETLNPLEAYARSAPHHAALSWARILNQASAILVRTRVPGLMNQAPTEGEGTPFHLERANHFLDVITSLQNNASGLSVHDARELRQISDLIPGMKAWNLNHLQEAENLFQGLADNPLAAASLSQVQTQRRMERCGPLGLVLRATLRNAYENRIQNMSTYRDSYVETPEEHIEHFLSAVEHLHSSGNAATYEEAVNQVLEQEAFKHDAVLQDFFHSPLEVCGRVKRFLHEGSNLSLNSAQVRALSLNLAHDLGELSSGYMADLWGAVKSAPSALWETISGREGTASTEYLRRYARLEFRTQDSVGVSGTFHFFSLAATPIRLSLWMMGNLLGDANLGSDFLSNLRGARKDASVLWNNGWSHLGYSRSGISGEYEAAERYMSAAREIAQGYQNDRTLRNQATQLLNEDLGSFEGMYQFGEVVRQCTIVGARSQQDIIYSAISIGASLSGSYFVGKAVQNFSLVGLRSALISGAVNGMFQTCAQSLEQVGNYRRDQHLTHESYNFIAQMSQSGFSGAFSSLASVKLTRATFHIAATRLLGNAALGGAREVRPLLGLALKANQFLTGEVFSEMAADRMNQTAVEELKEHFDLGWMTSQREIDRIHGIQEFAGTNTPFVWDFLGNITGEVLNLGEVTSHATQRFDSRAHERQMYLQYAPTLERMGFSATEIRNIYRMDIREGFFADSKNQEEARTEASSALQEAIALVEGHEERGGHAEDLVQHLTENIREEMIRAASLFQPKQNKEQQLSLGIKLLGSAISASTRTNRVSVTEVANKLSENIERFYQNAGFYDAEREAIQNQILNHLLNLSPKARHKFVQKSEGLGNRLRKLTTKVLGEEKRDEKHTLLKNFLNRVFQEESGFSFHPHSSPLTRNLNRLEKTVYSRLNAIEKVLKSQAWMKEASVQDRQMITQKLLEESLDQKFLSRLFNREIKNKIKEIRQVYLQLYNTPLSLEGRGQGEGVYRNNILAPTQAQFLAFILRQSSALIPTPYLLQHIQNGQMKLDWDGEVLSFKKEEGKKREQEKVEQEKEGKEERQESKGQEKKKEEEEKKKEKKETKKAKSETKQEAKPGYSEHPAAKSNIQLIPSPLRGEGQGEGDNLLNSPSLGPDQAQAASKKNGPLGLNPEDHTQQVTPELLQSANKVPTPAQAEMFATLEDGSALSREEVQIEVLQALGGEGGSTSNPASPSSPRVNLRRVSEIIVAVHEKVRPLFQANEVELTLRDILRGVSVIQALDHVNSEADIFEDLTLLLRGRVATEESKIDVTEKIQEIEKEFLKTRVVEKLEGQQELAAEQALREEVKRIIREGRGDTLNDFLQSYSENMKIEFSVLREVLLLSLSKEERENSAYLGMGEKERIDWIKQYKVQGELDWLKSLLQQEDGNTRAFSIIAIEQLATVNDLEWLESLVRGNQKNEDEFVRRIAVKAIGKLGASNKLEWLKSLLRGDQKDSTFGVGTSAMEALTPLLNSKDLDWLKSFVQGDQKDKSYGVRSSAVKAIGRFASSEDLEWLKLLVQGDQKDEMDIVRSSALEVIGKLASSEDLDWLKSCVQGDQKNEKWAVRIFALNVIGQLGSIKDLEWLESVILGDAKDEEDEIRAAALEALGQLGNANKIEWLKSFVRGDQKDKSPDVQSSAVKAIGQLGSAQDLEWLKSLIQGKEKGESSKVQRSAVEAIVKLGSSEDLEWLKSLALGREIDHIVASVIEAIAQLDRAEDLEWFKSLLQGVDRKKNKSSISTVIQILNKKLPHWHSEIQNQTQKILSIYKSELEKTPEKFQADEIAKLNALLEKLVPQAGPSEEEQEMRAWVKGRIAAGKMDDLLEFLNGFSEDKRVLDISHLILNCKDPLVLKGMLNYSYSLDPEEAADTVFDFAPILYNLGFHDLSLNALEKLLESKNDSIVLETVTVLNTLGDKKSRPVFERLLNHNHPVVIKRAANALGALGDKNSVPALLKLLTHENVEVLIAVCKALGSLGYLDLVIPKLDEFLKSENVDIVLSAASALGDLGDKKRCLANLESLVNKCERSRFNTMMLALAKYGNDSTKLFFEQSLEKRESSNSRNNTLITAIGVLGDKSASQTLIPFLSSSVTTLVESAASALSTLLGLESSSLLLPLLDHEDKHVAIHVAKILGGLGFKDIARDKLKSLVSDQDPRFNNPIAEALNEIDPSWDADIQSRFSLAYRVYQEECNRPAEDFDADIQKPLETLLTQSLEANKTSENTASKDSSGETLTQEKISELRQLIPSKDEDFDLIGPTIDAVKALIAGILAKEPVLLMGPTGVGKNAVINWLANRMKRPVFRVQFHKEMDEGQLLGHFTIESTPLPKTLSPFPLPQGAREQKRVIFEEGLLLDAIRLGGWCVFDEINLAREGFLVSLNDITQQIKSGTIYVKQGGKVVAVPVHEDFRLIATGNPEGYGGRKVLEQSVASRWLTMKLRDFRVEELQTILKNRTERRKKTVGAPLAAPQLDAIPCLSEASIAMLPKILESLKVAAGEEGLITLRTLKRVAARIEEEEDSGLWEKNEDGTYRVKKVNRGEGREDFDYILNQRGWEVLAKALGAEVLDGLSEEKYQAAKAMILFYFVKAQNVEMSEEKIEALLDAEVSEGELGEEISATAQEFESAALSLRASENERGNHPSALGGSPRHAVPRDDKAWLGRVEECSAWEDLISVPTTRKLAYKVLDSFRRKDYVILEGLPAVSKSAVIKWIGKLLKQEVKEVTGSGDLSISEMLGVPFINEEGEIVFREGALLEAITRGSLLLINEANLIPPEVLERLNSLLDDARMVMLTENGEKKSIIAHPNFRLIFTQNPAGMSGGRIALSPALLNKFRRIHIRKDFTEAELEKIVEEKYAHLNGVSQAMIQCHRECAKILAQENQQITLRDLLRWGAITTVTQEDGTLPPDEALMLGAELVYAGRVSQGAGREMVLSALQKLREKTQSIKEEEQKIRALDPPAERAREEISSWIREGESPEDLPSLVALVAKKLNLPILFTALKMISCEDIAFLEAMAKEYPDPLIQLEAIVRMGQLGFQDKALEVLKKLPASKEVTEAYVRLGRAKDIPIEDLIKQNNFKLFHEIDPQACAEYLDSPIPNPSKDYSTRKDSLSAEFLLGTGVSVKFLKKKCLRYFSKNMSPAGLFDSGTFALNLDMHQEVALYFFDYLKDHLKWIPFPESLEKSESQDFVWENFGRGNLERPYRIARLLSVYARLGWFNPFTSKVQEALFQKYSINALGAGNDLDVMLENYRKAFGSEFIAYLKNHILEFNDNLSVYRFLNQHDPDWMKNSSPTVPPYYKAYKEELARPAAEALQDQTKTLQSLLNSIPVSGTENGVDSSLRQLIPPEEKDFDLIGPTIDALKALIAGILAKEPVLLMGPTGVGKNAVIRWLAHRMKKPVFRVQFHKEMDEGQLLGHFTIESTPLPSPLPQGAREIKKRVVFEEGRLLDAIRFGGWCVFDEINLAREGFLVSLNDITQQIKSGTIYVKQGGKIVAVPVHEDFRLIATGNPEDYSDRKALEQSVASRWLTMKLRDFRVEELQTILKNRTERRKALSLRASENESGNLPSALGGLPRHSVPRNDKLLSEASISMLPKILEQLRISSGEEGLITIRTLKRVAARIEEVEAEGLWEMNADGSYKVKVNGGEGREDFDYILNQRGWEVLAKAVGAEVLDGLTEEKYELAKAALINETKMTDEKLEALLDAEVSEGELEEMVSTTAQEFESAALSLRASENERGNPPSALGGLPRHSVPRNDNAWLGRVEECSAWEDLISVPTTRKLAYKVLDSFRRKDYVILEGLPAVSKSAVIKWIGKLLKQEVIEVTGSGDLSISEMLGVPTIGENGEIVFRKGALLEAITRGSLLVINEANLIPAEVLERLNSLLDDERMVMLTENGEKKPIKAHPNFRLIFTQNPAGMSGGRIEFSPALINKFRKIQIRKDFTDTELQEIVSQKFKKYSSVSEAMVKFHRKVAAVFASTDENLTLRDLLRWGAITSAVQDQAQLSAEEALMLGAELVYAGRVPQGEGREGVLNALEKLKNETTQIIEEENEIRTWVKQQINETKADSIADFWNAFAEKENLSEALLKSRLLLFKEENILESLIDYKNGNLIDAVAKAFKERGNLEQAKDIYKRRFSLPNIPAKIRAAKELAILGDQHYRRVILEIMEEQKNEKGYTGSLTGGYNVYRCIEALSEINDPEDENLICETLSWLMTADADSSFHITSKKGFLDLCAKVGLKDRAIEVAEGFLLSSDPMKIICAADVLNKYGGEESRIRLKALLENLLKQAQIDLSDKLQILKILNLRLELIETAKQQTEASSFVLAYNATKILDQFDPTWSAALQKRMEAYWRVYQEEVALPESAAQQDSLQIVEKLLDALDPQAHKIHDEVKRIIAEGKADTLEDFLKAYSESIKIDLSYLKGMLLKSFSKEEREKKSYFGMNLIEKMEWRKSYDVKDEKDELEWLNAAAQGERVDDMVIRRKSDGAILTLGRLESEADMEWLKTLMQGEDRNNIPRVVSAIKEVLDKKNPGWDVEILHRIQWAWQAYQEEIARPAAEAQQDSLRIAAKLLDALPGAQDLAAKQSKEEQKIREKVLQMIGEEKANTPEEFLNNIAADLRYNITSWHERFLLHCSLEERRAFNYFGMGEEERIAWIAENKVETEQAFLLEVIAQKMEPVHTSSHWATEPVTPSSREEALKAFIEIQGVDAFDLLERLALGKDGHSADEDPNIRVLALEALVKLKHPQIHSFLEKVLLEEDKKIEGKESVQGMTCFLLVEAGHPRAFDLLKGVLRDEQVSRKNSNFLRGEALMALGRMNDPRVPDLIECIFSNIPITEADTDPYIRQLAVLALEKLKDSRVFDLMKQVFLNKDEDETVRMSALVLLAQQGNPDAIPVLEQILKSTSPKEKSKLRLAAIEALGHLGGEQSFTLLNSILTHRTEKLLGVDLEDWINEQQTEVMQAIHSLVQLADPRTSSIFRGLLKEDIALDSIGPNTRVRLIRSELVTALGKLKVPNLFELLKQILVGDASSPRDQSPLVRKNALLVLLELKDSRSFEILEQCLIGEDAYPENKEFDEQDMRQTAAEGLKQFKNEKAVQVLEQALIGNENQPAEQNEQVCLAALKSLEAILPDWFNAKIRQLKNYFDIYLQINSQPAAALSEQQEEVVRHLVDKISHPSVVQDSELRQLIPSEDEDFDLIGPTIDALKALTAGILAKEPVLLMGPTGVGKNAVIRYLAHRMKRAVFRVQFHKEMDEGQLLGHFSIVTSDQLPDGSKGGGEKRKRVVFEEGPLLDAIRLGGWCVFDEINLAREGFLVSLNDITQQIKSGTIYVKQGGKIVPVKVHENFRLIATGNPEGYGGRKVLEQSVASRWLTMKLRDFRVEELQTILKNRTERRKKKAANPPSPPFVKGGPGGILSEASISMLPKILEPLRVSSGEEGLITLRTLKRVAARIEEVEAEGLWEKNADETYKVQKVRRGEGREDFDYILNQRGWEVLAKALGAEVLDGLTEEKYELVKAALKLFLINETGMTEERLEALLNPEASEGELGEMVSTTAQEFESAALSLRASENERGNPPSALGGLPRHSVPRNDKAWPARVEECSAWENLVAVPTTRTLAYKVLDSFRRKDYVILEGLPAVSKSAVIKWIGKLLKQEVIEVTGSGEMSISEMLGVPFINEEGEIEFRKGALLEAITRGSLLVINESMSRILCKRKII